jgi:hypothetical protein
MDEAYAALLKLKAETIDRISSDVKARIKRLRSLEERPFPKVLMPLLPSWGGKIYPFLANPMVEPQS